jgi:hypothetical protein
LSTFLVSAEATGFEPSGATYVEPSDSNLHERQEITDFLFYVMHSNATSQTLQSGSSSPNSIYPISAIPQTRIPQEMWIEVAKRNANGESLRQLAGVYGVSHEAIRQIVRRLNPHSTD